MRTIIILAVLALATSAQAKDVIRCTSESAPEVIMALNAEKMLNRTVSCISGEFVFDMTPCATDGGFGLSYPTGTAGLAKIVDRWQDYGDHFGGVVHHYTDQQTIHFSGGWMGFNGYESFWSFSANRLTGTAKLIIEEGQDGAGEYAYTCARASQKF